MTHPPYRLVGFGGPPPFPDAVEAKAMLTIGCREWSVGGHYTSLVTLYIIHP